MNAQRLTRVGQVSNGYSSYLSMLAVDAAHVGSWRGPSNGGDGDDFQRANEAAEQHRYTIDVGGGQGVVVEIGECGRSDVHRVGDTLVMVEHYRDDDEADCESLGSAIVSIPTHDAEQLGTVRVDSGVLALVALVEAGAQASADQLAAVLAEGARGTGYGVLVSLPPGGYDIWREELGDIEDGGGTIASRVRIVPTGTPVVEGTPVAALPRRPPAVAAPTGQRRVVDGWAAVHSLAVATDGSAVAGEFGSYRAAGWTPSGELAWQHTLAARGAGSRYLYRVDVQIAGDTVLALAGGWLRLLDPGTGTPRRTLAVPFGTRAFALSPDHSKLVVKTGVTTRVLSYPQGALLAHFRQPGNQGWIAMAGDLLAVAGPQVHTFALSTLRHLATFTPPRSPGCGCFTPDRHLLIGDSTGRLGIWDPLSGRQIGPRQAGADATRQPSVTAVAASGRRLAAARDDGTVLLLDHAGAPVRHFDRHDASRPDTGATALSALAFSPDGRRLWVGAGLTGQPPGLSVYDI